MNMKSVEPCKCTAPCLGHIPKVRKGQLYEQRFEHVHRMWIVTRVLRRNAIELVCAYESYGTGLFFACLYQKHVLSLSMIANEMQLVVTMTEHDIKPGQLWLNTFETGTLNVFVILSVTTEYRYVMRALNTSTMQEAWVTKRYLNAKCRLLV